MNPYIISVVIAVVVLAIMLAVISLIGHQGTRKKQKKQDPLAKSLQSEKVKSDIILNAIEDGVVLVDTQNVIRVFNPGASKITGWGINEAEGLDFHSVFKFTTDKGVEYTDIQNPFSRVLEQQTTTRDHTISLVSRSGKKIALNISVSPMFDNHRVLTGVVAVFRDVSQERSEERQRAEFISTASHEMRTPVAAIEGYLALAMNDKVSKIDSKAREYLEKAHTSTQHLGKLFQDLLTSAKAEDGRLSSHPVAIEIGSLLEQLTEDLRFTAQKKSLGMEFVVGTTGQTIDASGGSTKVVQPLYYTYADSERLREVITNLFDNAVKYTDSGKVTIGLTGNKDVVQFYIKDTGPGIPPEDISHLFAKFYRVDNSATRTIGGTGLGLFICRKIVELYGGRIWVESEVGKGSTFFVNLPRIDATKAAELQAAEKAKSSPISTP